MPHDRLSNQSRSDIFRLHRSTFIHLFCVWGDNLLGGIFFPSPQIHKIHTGTGAEFETLHFLAVCSREAKERLPISTKPGKVKSTQNYGVHPARTEKYSLSFQQGWKETVRGIISVVRKLITVSIVGTAPLWVREPSVWASHWLKNNAVCDSQVPVNHTQHLFSLSAMKQEPNIWEE